MTTYASRLILVLMAFLVVLQLTLTLASAIPLDSDFRLNQENQMPSDSEEVSPLSREELRQSMARDLLKLRQAEAEILKRIRTLEAERESLSQRKRSHYDTMCLLNVVTCYGRRR